MKRLRGGFLAFLLLSGTLSAQEATKSEFAVIRRLEAGFHTGPIFAHSESVQNTQGAYPKGVELVWSRQQNNPSSWNLCACAPIHGFQLSYYDYDTKILGSGVNLGYILEPMFLLSDRSRLSLRGVMGLSYLTNPFHEITNPTNQSYSSHLSGYLALGFRFEYQFAEKWSVGPMVQFQHISNGGVQEPNKGINWPTIGLLTTYRPRSGELQRFERETFIKREGIRWDIGLFAMSKRVWGQDDGISKRFFLMGLSVQGAWQVGRINNLSAGTEISWDDALGNRLISEGKDISPWRWGLLFGHEFVLGRFLFSQRIGAYVYQAGSYYDALYHRWGLTYVFSKHWSTGFNLQAHRNVADYTDLRVIYSF